MRLERVIAPRLRLVILGSEETGWTIHASLLAATSRIIAVEGPYDQREYAELRLANLAPREIVEALFDLAKTAT